MSEVLTPDTFLWIILDQINRVNVNYLFCGRSNQLFDYKLQENSIKSSIITLDNKSISEVKEVTKKRLIGVGNIGKTANRTSYTLYNSYNNQLKFRKINYQNCR
ncbi:hypothetical protein [Geminocystis sp. NIES-3709]|uniref:hypothetical protein n=1 Tax=Geminocystis sp. NIES-3709 TaxID=1617448 RepID=UPI0005FCDC10|nr:hypothetical protein [Geminocystis sp. NIES-3709]BAQ66017.1 serine/threonine protein phosphatase [Geminocystis sp. NIES-3709]